MSDQRPHSASTEGEGDPRLFWGCFVALVATAFGFVVRGQILNDWQADFALSETQKGELTGVGLWPFAISIVLFSLVIDKIGYGKAMVFAFICHVSSAILTIFATGYNTLYWGTFIVALGNGTVEAVINPVVATMYPRAKTKWLAILHAGWPGGLVLGGALAIFIADMSWQWKVGLVFIPTAIYAVLLLGRTFPVQERVKAGVTYRAMLQEAGVLSCLIVVALIVMELGRVFDLSGTRQLIIGAVLVVGYGLYVRALGRPMFLLLVIIMMPLATTELGTDGWITPLMTEEMRRLEVHPGWVLVYTSLIMMILRFYAGAIVHRIPPLGILALSSGLAIVGLFTLSITTGSMILVAATIYAFGKTFFWPCMLGVVSERFPKGGALTLNAISGVGMLSVGVLGAPFLGYWQDKHIDQSLQDRNQALHSKVVADGESQSVFGTYRAVDTAKLSSLSESERQEVGVVQEEAKKSVLRTAVVFPCFMLVCYLGLIFYFSSKGGYKAVHLETGEHS